MARLPRLYLPDVPQHIIQRGINRQACFISDKDFAAYAYWLDQSARRYQVAVHAWVFMTNHVHLLVTPQSEQGVSRMMQATGRHYVRYFNHTYGRTGTLWEGRFKSCLVDVEDYLLACQRYIELNPVRAGMVAVPEDYSWSSYKANGFGKQMKLWTPHRVYLDLGATMRERAAVYRGLFAGHIDEGLVRQIRKATNRGMVLGKGGICVR
ncbi:MAG: transposase [Gammaproteobacteria bacterium]|nr:transposase [Gammaproteobacteria bacterium]